MFAVYAAVFTAFAADPWPMAVGRLEQPVAVRLADDAPDAAAVVASDSPIPVAWIQHESGEIAVRCGRDVRFRCVAMAPEGPVSVCAGPGDAPCLDGGRLDVPRRARPLPHRLDSRVPEACSKRLDPAAKAAHDAVGKVLAGGVDVLGSRGVLMGERGSLVAPLLHDACSDWMGSSGHVYNRAWCEVKAAEHVGLYARIVGSTEGLKPVVDSLVADCCVGGACPQDPWKPAEPAEDGP